MKQSNNFVVIFILFEGLSFYLLF